MPRRWQDSGGCRTEHFSEYALGAWGAWGAWGAVSSLSYLAHIAVVEGHSAIAFLGIIIQVPCLTHQLIEECALLVHCQLSAPSSSPSLQVPLKLVSPPRIECGSRDTPGSRIESCSIFEKQAAQV